MHNSSMIFEEREKLFNDLFSERIPQRVPINIGLGTEVCIQHEGLPVGKTLWTHEGLEISIENVIKNIKADMFPSDVQRSPLFSQISGNVFWKMSESGFMQHPETVLMGVEEYDELIKNPYDFILEKLLPRLCTNLDTDPVRRSLVFHMSLNALNNTRAQIGAISGKLSAKYGFYSIPQKFNGFCLNPFDMLADSFRGFTGAMSDIKRRPEKVVEATEALLPMLVEFAKPMETSNVGSTFMPCHMPTFMRTKEFEKFFYPGFSKLIHATAENGQAFTVFCEDDWTRYLDHLQELPQGTRFQFEYGDPKLIKEKLGKKHIISGLYPSSILKSGTKQQCIDKAKELIDILAPGGNYYFNFDKAPLSLESTNLDNLYAVINYVAENAVYENAGERSTVVDKKDTIKKVLQDIPKFHSKYYISREKYAQSTPYVIKDIEPIVHSALAGYESMMFKSILGML